MAGWILQAVIITVILYLFVDICTGTSDSAVLMCTKASATSDDMNGRDTIAHLDCSGNSLTSLRGHPGAILINSSGQLTLL